MKKLIFVLICIIVYTATSFIIQRKYAKKSKRINIIRIYSGNLIVIFMLLYMLNTKFLTIQQYSIEMSLTLFLQGIGVTLLEIETKKDEK